MTDDNNEPTRVSAEEIAQLKDDALEFAARLCEVKAKEYDASVLEDRNIRAAAAMECAEKIRSRITRLPVVRSIHCTESCQKVVEMLRGAIKPRQFCGFCGAGVGPFRRDGEGTCERCHLT